MWERLLRPAVKGVSFPATTQSSRCPWSLFVLFFPSSIVSALRNRRVHGAMVKRRRNGFAAEGLHTHTTAMSQQRTRSAPQEASTDSPGR